MNQELQTEKKLVTRDLQLSIGSPGVLDLSSTGFPKNTGVLHEIRIAEQNVWSSVSVAHFFSEDLND